MLRRFLSLTLVSASVLTAFATEPPPVKPKELQQYTNQVDQHEIERWGNRVVVSGEGMRAGEEVLYSKAMAPPEDDSGKFHITVWGPSTDTATLSLIKAFETSKLAALVADPPDNKTMAWAHFNFLHSDDPTQKWRFDDYKIPLTGPFPVITINPPRKTNDKGQYVWGNPTVLIDRIEANQIGSPEKLFTRIQASVQAFCSVLVKEGIYPITLSPSDAADAPENLTLYVPHKATAGKSQPYPWGPNQVPPATQFNPIFPPLGPATPAEPVKLTLEQIKLAIPDAPAEYVLEAFMKGYTDPSKLAMEWMLKKMQTQPATPVAPAQPTNILSILMMLLGGGSLGGISVWLATLWRTTRKATGQTLFIPNDATFNEIMNILKMFNMPSQIVPRPVAQAQGMPVAAIQPVGNPVSHG